ncbi:hypothetical protein SIPHO076v1_p0077 [Vibrio phage PS34B.1]|nr:hypothetical protein SIPHO076v1_p0077 [Vibrio phage PS34B.1]
MTETQIRSLEFIDVSPAGFGVYYCGKTDRTFKIRGRKVIVYFGRRTGLSHQSKYPSAFSQCQTGHLPC